jgi:hypothetical protein
MLFKLNESLKIQLLFAAPSQETPSGEIRSEVLVDAPAPLQANVNAPGLCTHWPCGRTIDV